MFRSSDVWMFVDTLVEYSLFECHVDLHGSCDVA